jgi:tetratricopeptide (TPR) repeat protein
MAGAEVRLETVVLKALAKDPSDRFASAGELRDEMRRYLENRPILSRPTGTVERVWRWCGRNPYVAVLSGVVAALTLALAIGSTAAALWFKHANDREIHTNADLRDANQRERARFNFAMDAVKLFHGEVSEDLLLKEKPFEGMRARLLQGAAEFYGRLEGLLRMHVDRESRLALGKAYDELGELTAQIGSKAEALVVHRKALAVRRELADETKADVASLADVLRSLIAIGRLQHELGDTGGALASFEEALRLGEGGAPSGSPADALQALVASSQRHIGILLMRSGKLAEALVTYKRALEIRQRLANASPKDSGFQFDLAQTYINIGTVLRETGEPVQATEAYHQGLEIYQRLVDANPTVIRFLGGDNRCRFIFRA